MHIQICNKITSFSYDLQHYLLGTSSIVMKGSDRKTKQNFHIQEMSLKNQHNSTEQVNKMGKLIQPTPITANYLTSSSAFPLS